MSCIDRYTTWSSSHVSAPNSLHRWAGYHLLAAALGHKSAVTTGHTALVPNLYVVLLSPHSSAAARNVMELAGRIIPHINASHLCHHRSTDGLFQEMIHCNRPVLHLTDSHWQRLTSGPFGACLADWASVPDKYLYWCQDSRRTLDRPCLNLLAALCASHASSLIRRRTLQDHFLFVHSPEMPLPEVLPAPVTPEGLHSIAAEVREHARNAPAHLSLDGVRDLWKTWVSAFTARAVSPLRKAQLDLHKRTCLKLAVLEHIGEENTPMLSEAALQRAIKSIEPLAASLDEIETTAAPDDEDDPRARQLARVARLIQRAGTIRWGELLRRSHLTRERLTELGMTLAESGQISVRIIDPPSTGGKPTCEMTWRVPRPSTPQPEPSSPSSVSAASVSAMAG